MKERKMIQKYSLLIAALIAGIFIGKNLDGFGKPKAEQKQEQKQGQNQAQNAQSGCVAEIGKKKNADGSIEDFFRFRASSDVSQGSGQSQAASQTQVVSNERSVDLFAGAGLSSKIKGWGAVEVIAGRHSFEYLTNGPEYVGLYKIKVISF